MRILLYFLFAPGLLFEQIQEDSKTVEQRQFSITVIADSFPSNERQLSYMSNGKAVNDTGKIERGKLVFTGEIDNPDYATIYFFNTPEKIRFILEPGTTLIDFKGSGKVVFNGSKTQDDFNTWNKMIEVEEAFLSNLVTQWVKKLWDEDYTTLTFLENQIDSAAHQLNQKKVQFIKQNKRSVVSGIMLANMFNNADNKVSHVMFKQLYSELYSNIKNLPYVRAFKENLRKNDLISVGKKIPAFTLPDTLGKPVSITDYKGKYTLIDFWASWCVPCRKESPLLVKAYKRFHSKGFEILSISFDNKRELWTNAIQKDQYVWANVSELKRWTNSLSEAWFIKSIPSNILIDPTGKIIARNLRGLRLEKKLEELFGASM